MRLTLLILAITITAWFNGMLLESVNKELFAKQIQDCTEITIIGSICFLILFIITAFNVTI